MAKTCPEIKSKGAEKAPKGWHGDVQKSKSQMARMPQM